ncbi:DNA-binding response regulator, LytR/AlgR family [Filimonas lacunae]|uniref:DNA-binding response regulator, LytR/AlgR family n=1 Tax=Filimonas lacunae TaxID=477680 RepID=A0A1N7RAL0_9BACT|nr:DNA-binding response regulator, LytR/AlgR family [Filimonas lacunae]
MLLDDELPGLTYLRMLCQQIPGVEVVKAFNDPMKLLEESKELDFDVCILDIEMPGFNGLEIAQLLHNKPVIFTTAYKEYAAEAFDLDAIDYIRKPIQKERLEKALQKAADKLQPQLAPSQFVQLNTSQGKALLYFNQLLLITTSDMDKRDKLALLDNGQTILLKNISFTQLLQLLPPDQFCRINKKEILAVKAVGFFSHDEITTNIPGPEGKPLQLVLGEIYRTGFLQHTHAR